MELKERCKQMIKELSIPTTAFCRKVHISTSAYYQWQKNLVVLSDAALKRMDEFLSKYGF